MAKSLPGLKQFRSDGCLSYILYDREAREAAVIDPHAGLMDQYRDFISELRLKPVWALDTHTHADHLSATHVFKNEFGCAIGMGEATQSKRPTRRLRPGELLPLGSLKIEVLSVPGHTPDSTSYACSGLVFTGDTLMIGASGRTDFPGASPAQMYGSLHRILGALPGETAVLPGHDYNDLVFSTLAVEKEKNPQWRIPTTEEFSAFKNAENILPPSDEMQRTIAFNMDANPPLPEVRAVQPMACGLASAPASGGAAIGVQDYASVLTRKGGREAYIDVREPGEFAEERIAGTENMPVCEIPLRLADLRTFDRVFVSCRSGNRSGRVARNLGYLGLKGVVNVTGGFLAWQKAGLPVESLSRKR